MKTMMYSRLLDMPESALRKSFFPFGPHSAGKAFVMVRADSVRQSTAQIHSLLAEHRQLLNCDAVPPRQGLAQKRPHFPDCLMEEPGDDVSDRLHCLAVSGAVVLCDDRYRNLPAA